MIHTRWRLLSFVVAQIFQDGHQFRVAVHAQPVLGVVDVYQVVDELLVGLADNSAAAFLRSEHHVIVQRIVLHGKTYTQGGVFFLRFYTIAMQ